MRENLFCRCCLSMECYKDMANEYYIRNKTENYSEMLLNIFNISVPINDERCLICEDCVSKLREAVAFKEQVLSVQDAVIRNLSDLNSGIRTDVVETKIEDDYDDFDDHVSDSFMWEDTKPTRENGHYNNMFVVKLRPKPAKDKVSITKETEQKKTSDTATKEKRKPTGKLREKPQTHKRSLQSLNTRENTLKLIQNSNLCIFRSLQTKFGCNYCKASFPDIKNLREHAPTHSNAKYLAIKVRRLRGLSFKNADISDLQCNICTENCTDLVELMNHLKNNHEITFHGAEHYLIPYKLQNGFKCVLCQLKFNTYLRLAMHMHTHYKNNVCETCGQSFINRLSLRTHFQSMHKEKKCSVCPAVFLTNSDKVKHLKKVHNIHNSKRHCNLCYQTFRYTYNLNEHKIKEHGVKRQVSNCGVCGKTFMNATNLKIHMRCVHIKERNYACSMCGMRFFTKCDQKRHERTHQDVRSFACGYCESKFKSKDSWRRHMKRQHGHVFGEMS